MGNLVQRFAYILRAWKHGNRIDNSFNNSFPARRSTYLKRIGHSRSLFDKENWQELRGSEFQKLH